MSLPILTFFNNKGGVGKTSLLYHLAWMFAELGQRVVVADLDPQANLTAAFLEEDLIDQLWNQEPDKTNTIYQAVESLQEMGDIKSLEAQKITSNLYLITGDVRLSSFEDTLSTEWSQSLNDKNVYRPMRIQTAFWHVIQAVAQEKQANIILVDVGPNLGAINRSVLIATDYVIIPMGADLFSLQGLQNLGPTLREWRKAWQKRLTNWHDNSDSMKFHDMPLPKGEMSVIGYLYQQYGVRLNRPVKAYDKWINRIPSNYRQYILNEAASENLIPKNDPYFLAEIKHYRSLIPMSQEQHKPIFKLTAADGAIGSHAEAVNKARGDFMDLSQKIAKKIGLTLLAADGFADIALPELSVTGTGT